MAERVVQLLEHYGVKLLVPEAGRRVDYASEHDKHGQVEQHRHRPWAQVSAG